MAPRKSKAGFSEPKSRYVAPRRGGQPAVRKPKKHLPGPESLPDGTVRYFLSVGAKGRVLLPTDMRKAMGLEEGDVVTAWLKAGEVRMHSHRRGLEKIRQEAKLLPSAGVYASDELIAERRAENARDEETPRRSQR